MVVNTHRIDFSYLAKEPTLRSDINYIVNDIAVSQNEYYRFDDLFLIVSNDSVDIEKLGVFEYAEISNVSSLEDITPVRLDMNDQNELNANYFQKIKKGDIIQVQKGDILISKVRPYLKKIIYVDDSNSHIYFTSAFIHIRPFKCSRILFYLLKGHFINYLNSISRQGKGYPTLNEKDLHFMKFCKKEVDCAFKYETSLLLQIKEKEKNISALKSNRVSDTIIINEVFGSFFNWDYSTFFAEKARRKFSIDFSSLSSNYDLRMSAKFHRPAGIFVSHDIEEKTNCLRVKNFLEDPITLGASVSPSDFDDRGDYYYISMASVKNFKVELDESQLLSEAYVRIPKNAKKKVKIGDIIMTRSGAAIGKFALVKDSFNAIHSDFTMRIRLKNINRMFAYYYFRSAYFQYLIEINYKGLQNNNIFPNQIQEFPIPDILMEHQYEIVKTIKWKLTKQNEIKNQIEVLRKGIDEIIEKQLSI